MEGFAQQLASLQRAASRATNQADQTGGGGKGDGRWQNTNDGGHRLQHHHRDGRGGDGNRKRGRDDNNHLNSSNKNNRGAFRTLIDQVAERYKKDSLSLTTFAPAPAAAIVDAATRDDNMPQQSNSKLLHREQPQQKIRQHQQQRHVALLFLTIDDLPHEHIWRMWLQSHATSSNCAPILSSDNTTTAADKTDVNDEINDTSRHQPPLRVSVLVHAKYPERIKSAWLKQHHLLRRKSSQLQQQLQPKQYGGCDKSDISNRYNNANSNKFSTARNSGPTEPPAAAAFHTRRPEWGSIEITRAMLDLLQAGLQIGQEHGSDNDTDEIFVNDDSNVNYGNGDNSCITPVDRFIFVSESCLPVVTLAEMEMALFGPRMNSISSNNHNISSSSSSISATTSTPASYDKSWINAASSPNNGYALQYQWNAILDANNNNNSGDPSSIPNTHIWKADQWVMLTRAHASAIISLPNKYLGNRQLYSQFRKCRASDEMYIPTALSILGILHRPNGIREVGAGTMGEACAGEYIRRRRMTYADWSVSAKNPASFTCREWKEVVEKARKEGCLFARKFVRASSSPSSSVRDGKEWKKQGRDRSHGNVNDNDLNDGLISVESWSNAVVGMKPG
jgi:hypothetical protein